MTSVSKIMKYICHVSACRTNYVTGLKVKCLVTSWKVKHNYGDLFKKRVGIINQFWTG